MPGFLIELPPKRARKQQPEMSEPKPEAIPVTLRYSLPEGIRQDIATLKGIAERVYHLPGGKNGGGAVAQCCARVGAFLEGMS